MLVHKVIYFLDIILQTVIHMCRQQSRQIVEDTFSRNTITDINKAICDAMKYSTRELTYRSLEMNSLHLRVYTDGSFSLNYNIFSEVRYLIILCDCSKTFYFLDYSSKKSKRVVRFVIGGEL